MMHSFCWTRVLYYTFEDLPFSETIQIATLSPVM
jgi:hypothetical protein